ncbi:MAG: hypothetical protein B6242_12550, partial [Anaerolineaceae bacterium 4572_78]
YESVVNLLITLPTAGLNFVEQFIGMIKTQLTTKTIDSKTPYLYPTVAMPASSLLGLVGVMPDAVHGDALSDTKNHLGIW